MGKPGACVLNRKKTNSEKITFSYHAPEDVKPTYVNGVMGGINVKGELFCHFFLEYTELPYEETLTVVDEKPEIEFQCWQG
jgi:hypothetical protein